MPPRASQEHGRRQGCPCARSPRRQDTTDHISPAGNIAIPAPAAEDLPQRARVKIKDYNSYGARRGSHEVMMRGTFANIRIENR